MRFYAEFTRYTYVEGVEKTDTWGIPFSEMTDLSIAYIGALEPTLRSVVCCSAGTVSVSTWEGTLSQAKDRWGPFDETVFLVGKQ